MYYGLLKEPDIQILPAPIEDEEEVEETPDKPKKKKSKKDNIFMKKPKSDPNAPPNDRIPLPELYNLFSFNPVSLHSYFKLNKINLF